jgi:predicted ester cyclase
VVQRKHGFPQRIRFRLTKHSAFDKITGIASSSFTLEKFMNDIARQQLIETYIAAYNRFDIDGMAAALSSDIRFDNFAGDVKTHETVGIDAFRTLAQASTAMFSQREQSVLALQFDPDEVIATIVFSGTLAADIPDGPKAGATVAMEGPSASMANGLPGLSTAPERWAASAARPCPPASGGTA